VDKKLFQQEIEMFGKNNSYKIKNVYLNYKIMLFNIKLFYMYNIQFYSGSINFQFQSLFTETLVN